MYPLDIQKLLGEADVDHSKYIVSAWPIISAIHRPEQKSFSSSKIQQNEPWTSAYITIVSANGNINQQLVDDKSYELLAN